METEIHSNGASWIGGVPTVVLWCQHPLHAAPLPHEHNERWVGLEKETDLDKMKVAIKKHCKMFGRRHKQWIVQRHNYEPTTHLIGFSTGGKVNAAKPWIPRRLRL